MAKDEHKNDASNQLNLTVVALVALVAIVGLVALVMNAASVKTQLATGSGLASAESQNTVGEVRAMIEYMDACSCSGGDGCDGTGACNTKNKCEAAGGTWSCS